MSAPAAGRDAFVAWARAAAIPLDGTDPGLPVSGFAPLLPLLSGARVVGVGEATHGTREFFRIKHRITALLAEHAGFDQFQIEAPLAESLPVLDHIHGGDVDADVALAASRFWVWDTEEVRDLITWLRARGMPYLGFDVQSVVTTLRLLLAGLADPAQATTLAAALEPLLDETTAECYPTMDRDRIAALDAAIATLAAASSRMRPRHGLDVLTQLRTRAREWPAFARATTARGGLWDARAVRDSQMAAQVLSWLDAPAEPSAGAVVWAHNQHIARDGFSGRFPSMGGHLAGLLGDRYRPVGLCFARGGFQAIGPQRRLAEFRLDAPAPGSLEEALADVGPGLFALDLRQVSPEAGEWLAGEPPIFDTGSGYEPGSADNWGRTDPRHQFDVLVFVDTTSRARPNPTGDRALELAPVADLVANLDWADGPMGSAPPSWAWRSTTGPDRYVATVVRADEPVLLIHRLTTRWRHGRGWLHQRLLPGDLRGRRVTLAGALRQAPGHRGSVRLRIEAAEEHTRVAVSAAAPADGTWGQVTAELVVPTNSAGVEMGIAITGADPAWIGPLTWTVDREEQS